MNTRRPSINIELPTVCIYLPRVPCLFRLAVLGGRAQQGGVCHRPDTLWKTVLQLNNRKLEKLQLATIHTIYTYIHVLISSYINIVIIILPIHVLQLKHTIFISLQYIHTYIHTYLEW